MPLRSILTVTLLTLAIPSVGRAQLIVAHRGASHDAPENTLAAFELAWQQESDGIEGDFYLTADNQIVCIHDKDTQRTTGKKMVVEQSNLETLRTLDAGRWKDAKWAGERIPTFAEVFQTVPKDRLFVIELKSKSKIVPVLAKELSKLNTDSIRMLIISFDAHTVRECKRQLPKIPAHWLTSFKEVETDRGKAQYPSPAGIAETLRQCGADGVGMKGNISVIDPDFITRLQSAGCDEFHVWTIDSTAEARYFQNLGVVGITTNRPKTIGAAIRPLAKSK